MSRNIDLNIDLQIEFNYRFVLFIVPKHCSCSVNALLLDSYLFIMHDSHTIVPFLLRCPNVLSYALDPVS